jgi:hypothetical protein
MRAFALCRNLCDVALEKVYMGMEVDLFFVDAENEEKVPQFRPARKCQ